MNVAYPCGGERVILHWWSPADHGHLIVARTIQQAERIIERVFGSEPEATIRDYCHAEIVDPSERMIASRGAWKERKAREDFWCEFGFRVREFVSATGEWPPGLARCKTYVPKESDDNEETDSEHDRCMACISLITTVDGTDPYDRISSRYFALTGSVAESTEFGTTSTARCARDDEILWFAYMDHDSDGTCIAAVDDLAEVFDSGVLFLFRRGADVDPWTVLATRARCVEAKARRREEELSLRRETINMSSQMETALIRAVFGDAHATVAWLESDRGPLRSAWKDGMFDSAGKRSSWANALAAARDAGKTHPQTNVIEMYRSALDAIASSSPADDA